MSKIFSIIVINNKNCFFPSRLFGFVVFFRSWSEKSPWRSVEETPARLVWKRRRDVRSCFERGWTSAGQHPAAAARRIYSAAGVPSRTLTPEKSRLSHICSRAEITGSHQEEARRSSSLSTLMEKMFASFVFKSLLSFSAESLLLWI